MIGWLVLAAYIVGFILTWIMATGMLGKSELFGPSKYTSVLESALISGWIGFMFALLWPLALACLVVYRISMKRVKR